ncbi:MAG: hypothetical protein ACR2GY_09450 [Phycisphaerales bacterium]
MKTMHVCLLMMMAMVLTLAGCASSRGPESIVVSPGAYAQTFDAAIECARDMGLYPETIDRRAGIITTTPRMAGSILEPWDRQNASLSQSLENTLQHQRRVARFEFVPVDQAGDADDVPGETSQASVVPLDPVDDDLTQSEHPLRLDVIVMVEREYRPGIRRSTWTHHVQSRTIEIDAAGQPVQGGERFWTTVKRDHAAERRLLAAIDKRVQATRRERP